MCERLRACVRACVHSARNQRWRHWSDILLRKVPRITSPYTGTHFYKFVTHRGSRVEALRELVRDKFPVQLKKAMQPHVKVDEAVWRAMLNHHEIGPEMKKCVAHHTNWKEPDVSKYMSALYHSLSERDCAPEIRQNFGGVTSLDDTLLVLAGQRIAGATLPDNTSGSAEETEQELRRAHDYVLCLSPDIFKVCAPFVSPAPGWRRCRRRRRRWPRTPRPAHRLGEGAG